MRVADLIAQRLVALGVRHCFSVTGGGAMHLNDAFGEAEGLACTYLHHEQACAMAAEGYARIAGGPALLCVTSGPGAINALNGVFGAFTDSIPLLVVSQTARFKDGEDDGMKADMSDLFGASELFHAATTVTIAKAVREREERGKPLMPPPFAWLTVSRVKPLPKVLSAVRWRVCMGHPLD